MEQKEKNAVNSLAVFGRVFMVLAVLNGIVAVLGLVGGMITSEASGIGVGLACVVGAITCVFFRCLIDAIGEISDKINKILEEK